LPRRRKTKKLAAKHKQTNKQTNKQRKTRRGDAGELQKAEAKLDDVNGRPSIVNHLILIRVIILLS